VSRLSEQQTEILEFRDGGLTLRAIGQNVGLSKERVRQILIETRKRLAGGSASVLGTPEYFYVHERFEDHGARGRS
jgi:DNA-directed RNA polymerase sigma subunit (sigma70/sigma32)